MSKKALYILYLLLVLISVFLFFAVLAQALSDVDQSIAEAGQSSQGGDKIEVPEELPPAAPSVGDTVQYTKDDFQVLAPVFSTVERDSGDVYGIRFRARVSNSYKAAVEGEQASFYVLICHFYFFFGEVDVHAFAYFLSRFFFFLSVEL